jgi:hypothetical protein
MHFDRPAFTKYCRTYWKVWAGVALAAGAALNGAFEFVSPQTATTIGLLAAAAGIGMHHKGDPLPPLPNLQATK